MKRTLLWALTVITKVRMDEQRRIRIPKRAGLEGRTFLLLALGTYHILFPVPSEKPELDVEGPIAELLTQADLDAGLDITERLRRRERNAHGK